MSYTQEKWVLNENTNWKTNPFSITARKRGVHSATIANIPTRMTIPPLEQQANARLIAAAPEMLRALQTILNMALMDKGYWAKTVEIEAHNAIAKATNQGESK